MKDFAIVYVNKHKHVDIMFHAALLDAPRRLSADTTQLVIFDVQDKSFQKLVFSELLTTAPLIISSLTKQLSIDILRPCHALFQRKIRRHSNVIYRIRCLIKLSFDITYAFSLFGFCKKYSRCIKFGFSDHGCYSYAGSIEAILVSLAKPYYSTGYPYSMNLIRPGTSSKVCDYRKIVVDTPIDDALTHHKCHSSSYIPYLIAKNKNIQSLGIDLIDKLNLADFIIYAQSFSDAQNYFGYDNAFLSIKDWTEWSLSNLLRTNKLVILKSHPNYWADFDSEVIMYDKKTFQRIIEKFTAYPNLIIINQPISNSDLLPHLSSSIKCITHHGSVASETLSYSLKTISSSIHPLNKYFSKSKNYFAWSSKQEYKLILKQLLNNHNPFKEDFPNLLDIFYANHSAYGSENSTTKIIADFFDLSYTDFTKSPSKAIAHKYNALPLRKRLDLYHKVTQSIIENPNNSLS